jgi:two-component system, LytTR family, response regulator AlgR
MAGGSLDVTDMVGVYIADDEPPAVDRLKRLLADVEGCEVLGSSTRPEQALLECARLHPDVILLDVEMPGLDGVSLASRLTRMERPPAVVFVTAYEQYAVEAFDLAALDYLVKPVSAQRLARAMDRIRTTRPAARKEARLVARLGDRILSIPLADIRVLQAEDKYTNVYYSDGTALIDDSLVSIEERFPGRFMRIHRNALVSRAHLKGLIRDRSGQDRVEIEGVDMQPLVSRRNLPGVRQELMES